MTPESLAALSEGLETVALPARHTIYEAGSRVEKVYFPIDCVISVVTTMSDGAAIETGTVGREGMCGAQVALGGRYAAGRWFCQIPGLAYRMEAAAFVAHYQRDEHLRTIVGRYLDAVIDVLSQSAACNRLHLVAERCARWLLATHDRVGSDEFPLTHEALATMLGVRRAGVSIAAAALQAAGFISYKRGRFVIRERSGLQSAACECYAATRGAYDRFALQH